MESPSAGDLPPHHHAAARSLGPRAYDKGKPAQRRGRKANEATARSICAMPVGLPWTGDSTMHASHIVFGAILIAAVACTDATSPAAPSDSLATTKQLP